MMPACSANTIPNVAHFVFGFREQYEPFHILHYLSIESCRQVIKPDVIFMHYHHLPLGYFWDLIRPYLTLHKVGLVPEVLSARYSPRLVPTQYRYAHHADFVRLDALIEHGGIYADIDTIFIRRPEPELLNQRFVIGRESPIVDEYTGVSRRSLCNALLMAEPRAEFALRWRQEMASALNGTWSNHSCLLAQEIANEQRENVHIVEEDRFYPARSNRKDLASLLEEDGEIDTSESISAHLWAHLWWSSARTDFSNQSALGWTFEHLKNSRSPLAELCRPYLPNIDISDVEIE